MPAALSTTTIPTPTPTTFFSPTPGSPPGTTIPGVLDSSVGVSQLQYLTFNPKYFMVIYIGDIQRSSLITVNTVNITDAIILPLPERLQDHHGINYQESPLGVFLGGGLNSYYQSDFAAALGATATAVGQFVAGGANSPLTGGIQTLTNYAPNQFLTILLQGPQYKKHSFTWNFSPRNFGEADRLRKIINKLHNSAAPNIVQSLPLFKFPKVFQIAFMPNSKFLYKFKTAVLRDISIDYSGNGPSFHRSGDGSTDGSGNAPTNIIMKLDFWELAFWISGNWTDSNDPIDVNNNTPIPNPITGGGVGGGLPPLT